MLYTEHYIRNVIYGMLYTECYIQNIIYGTLYMERYIWNVIYGTLYTEHYILNVIYETLYMDRDTRKVRVSFGLKKQESLCHCLNFVVEVYIVSILVITQQVSEY